MAQAKKKTATKTAKKTTAKTGGQRKAATRATKCKDITNKERVHVYIITAMSMLAGILLFANAVMMIA